MSHKRFKKIRKLMRAAPSLADIPDREMQISRMQGFKQINASMSKRGMYRKLKQQLHKMGKTK